jgi:sugar-phosphatase
VSADDVVRGKPDPEPYRKGAELLGYKPEECIVVEDAPSGVGAGKAAGSRVLGVIGTHTLEQLEHADWVVSSLERVTAKPTGDGLELSFFAEKR